MSDEATKGEMTDRLRLLGAADAELAAFFALPAERQDFLAAWLALYRQDRDGVIAHRKGRRSAKRRAAMAGSPSKRIRNAVAARMWAALKGRSDGALFSRLGYSLAALTEHLASKFAAGMSWANYGAWHIDHVRPCASFDLADPEQFQQCWALTNLAPLWATDNVKKGARYGTA